MEKKFTLISLLSNKTFQKHFRFTITCSEHHAIKTKIHVPMSHSSRTLSSDILQHEIP